MSVVSVAIFALLAAPAPVPRPAAVPALEARQVEGLAARALGPALMGGRVSDVALDPSDPYRFYVGLATGGVMRTTDNGVTFQAVFERQPVASIGALAVAPSQPKVVWVGSGEANDRNSSGWGKGVFRSTDGGTTWTPAGLPRSRSIARLVVHPQRPDTAWVAAVGDLWQPGGERGLYRTTDGGASWKLLLGGQGDAAASVGCGDVVLDPQNPDVLYAALYARRRTPWSFVAGPEASAGQDAGGVFKSTDGGTTWRKLGGGLPARTGRIGLDVQRNDGRIVYAVVQSFDGGAQGLFTMRSRSGGVFRSADAGETWERVSDLNPRPFYFSQVRVDPRDERRVYLLGFTLLVSEDGGRSFREDRFKRVHADCHALAIDARDPRRLLLGTDGGVYQSFDSAANWDHLAGFAAGQFYRVAVDQARPYRICGGLQDNVSWLGPSRSRRKDGLRDLDWTSLQGGDGFACVFDADDPQVLYVESQQADVKRLDLRTGQETPLRPEAAEGAPPFRFHWNAPFIGSRHFKGRLYLAGERVFKLEQDGAHWSAISPPLTTPDARRPPAQGSGAENYSVVYALTESPLRAGLLWAGTDDGRLWLTQDDGAHWDELSATLPSAARGQWLRRIEASAHDARSVFLAVDAHWSGDDRPLLFRSDDLGRTWRDIGRGLPPDGPVEVVRQDPVAPALLFAGTEYGLFASIDAGEQWWPLGGLPTVAVDDLIVHPTEGDLIVATHGRSLYVLDDLRALRELTPEVRASALHLFAPRPVEAAHLLDGWGDSAGAHYRGENPPEGALLTYWVRDPGTPVKLAVTNALGQPVANLTAPAAAGLQRVSWNLKPSADLLSEYIGQGERFVAPGEYTLTLTQGEAKSVQKLAVSAAPGVKTR